MFKFQLLMSINVIDNIDQQNIRINNRNNINEWLTDNYRMSVIDFRRFIYRRLIFIVAIFVIVDIPLSFAQERK